MSGYLNRGRWVLTADDCRKQAIPLWWAGKVVNPLRLFTIKANLRSSP